MRDLHEPSRLECHALADLSSQCLGSARDMVQGFSGFVWVRRMAAV